MAKIRTETEVLALHCDRCGCRATEAGRNPDDWEHFDVEFGTIAFCPGCWREMMSTPEGFCQCDEPVDGGPVVNEEPLAKRLH